MLSARGKYLLFADADGATKFADIAKLEAEIKKIKTEDVSIYTVRYWILIDTVVWI